jgi:hypothetical protein
MNHTYTARHYREIALVCCLTNLTLLPVQCFESLDSTVKSSDFACLLCSARQLPVNLNTHIECFAMWGMHSSNRVNSSNCLHQIIPPLPNSLYIVLRWKSILTPCTSDCTNAATAAPNLEYIARYWLTLTEGGLSPFFSYF